MATHPNVDLRSLQNDASLIALKEQYDQSVNAGKSRFNSDPSQAKVDMNTFMQGVLEASQMQRQAVSEELEDVFGKCYTDLTNCYNQLSMVIDSVKNGMDIESDDREIVVNLASNVLPQLLDAKEMMDSVGGFLSSYKGPRELKDVSIEETFGEGEDVDKGYSNKMNELLKKKTMPEKLRKHRLDYTTHATIKPYLKACLSSDKGQIKKAVMICNDLYQFADKNVRSVMTYEGMKAFCNFRDSCRALENTLKKLL